MLAKQTHDDLPRTAGLDVALVRVLENKSQTRATVNCKDLFDRLVQYRNQEIGHAGLRDSAFLDNMGQILQAALAEFMTRFDVLAGRRLLFIPEIRQAGGCWLVERFALVGESPRRQAELELPRSAAEQLPAAERVYLETPPGSGPSGEGNLEGIRALHPLMVLQHETNEFYFLNGRRGNRQAEYLCYTTGDHERRADQGEQCAFLAGVLGMVVNPVVVAEWADNAATTDGPAPPSVSEEKLGEYELLDELGRGGMGVVYRAWQPSLGREVALKRLMRIGDAKAEARFRREIRALAKVDHPHVVKIHASGVDQNQFFYVMELLEGAPLSAVCSNLQTRVDSGTRLDFSTWQETVQLAGVGASTGKKTPSTEPAGNVAATPDAKPASQRPADHPRAEAPKGPTYVPLVVDLMRQVTEAAQALHDKGVIHRDIKPGNIMVTAGGTQAVLMDLGLAQLADEEAARLTQTRQFVGTLPYSSPEQLAGARLDVRTDVYSLGATLWELLTFRPLFGVTEETPTPDLILKIQQAEPERPGKYQPGLARDLETIVLKCLQKNPAGRYGSARELADDLRRFLAGEPVVAQPPTLGYLLRKRAWKYRFALGVLLCLLVLGIAGAIAEVLRISASLDRERTARQEAEGQRREALRQSALLAYGRAQGVGEKGRTADALIWLAQGLQLAAQAEDAPLQNALRINLAMWREHVHILKDVRPCAEPVSTVAVSADGTQVATGYWEGTVQVWVAGKGVIWSRQLHHDRKVAGLCFSPDGSALLSGGEDKKAFVITASSGEPQGPELAHDEEVLSVAWCAGGKQFLTGCMDGKARLWDLGQDKPRQEFKHQGPVWAVAADQRGQAVLTGSADETACWWQPGMAEPLKTYRHRSPVRAVAFHPFKDAILSATEDGTVLLWTKAGVNPDLDVSYAGRSLALSADGLALMTFGLDNAVRVLEPGTLRELRWPVQHPAKVTAAAFAGNSRTAITGTVETVVRTWELARGDRYGLALPQPQGQPCYAVAFSSDGKWMLTGNGNEWDLKGQVCVWETAKRRFEGKLDDFTGPVKVVAFSPDGNLVLAGGNGNKGYLWQMDPRRVVAELAHASWLTSGAFNSPGDLLATASRDGTACLWNPAGGKRAVLVHQEAVWVVRFSPADPRLVATGSADKTACLWDAAGTKVRTFSHQAGVRALVFSPDGAMLLTGCDDGATALWDVKTGQRIRPFPGHRLKVNAVAFGDGGKVLATASEDNTARLWETASGAPRGPFLEHLDAVLALAFCPKVSASLLATASRDSTARLWDTGTGQPVGPPLMHDGAVNGVAFDPSGTLLVTASDDGRAHL
jgi:eukaryotic-like serine/threonine-protein kinase